MNILTQTSFVELEYASKKRQTRRKKCLVEMEQVVPWALLLAQLEPHYPRSGRRCRQPMALNRMLRIYCMQQWFSYLNRQIPTGYKWKIRCMKSTAFVALPVSVASPKRCRSLEKNTAQVNGLVGLANLYLLRRQLMAA